MVTAIVLLDVDRDQINPVAEQLAGMDGVTAAKTSNASSAGSPTDRPPKA